MMKQRKGLKPANLGLQGEWFIHNTTETPKNMDVDKD